MSENLETSTELAVTTENAVPATTTTEAAPAPATIDTNPTPGTEVAPVDSSTTVVYNPNYKFKVMDKEHEVPDFLRGIIKDQETEKKIIDILQKAEGLPIAKERLRGERDEYRNKFTQISTQVNKASQLYQRGDIDGFLGMLKIPEQRMLQWAADKVNYSQLPVEQRQVHDQSLEAQRRAYELEEQNKFYQEQVQEQVSRAKQAQLDFEFAKPDVKTAMTQYDAVVGKPGAFMEEVVNRGRLAWHQRKEDISPEQAVQEVLSIYGKFLNRAAPATQAVQAQSAAPTQGAASSQQKQTVIPNLQGKSSSPVKKGPRSLDELRKLASEANAS